MPGEQPQKPPQEAPPRGRLWLTVLIVSVGLLVLGSFLILKTPTGPSLRLTTCFQDVSGLRAGAKVRVAGVDVGTVRDVRAQPMDKACPGAVEMELRTPYELRIPKDSVASTANAGLLGETFLEIDISGSSGPPIQNGGRLPSRESVKFSAETVDRALKAVGLLKELSDEDKASSSKAANAPGANPSSKPSPSSSPK